MIAKIVGIEMRPGDTGPRIMFVDHEGRNWYVTLMAILDPLQLSALAGALRSMDLMANNPEKAVELGVINRESLEQANAQRDDQILEQMDRKKPAKAWKM